MVSARPGVTLIRLVPNCVNSETDEAVHALADRGEQHHGRDAHRDAERREQGAHAVRAHRVPGEAHEVRPAHAQRLPASATTGSSRAARRAGMSPKTMPLATAISIASATAQAGAPTGNAG